MSNRHQLSHCVCVLLACAFVSSVALSGETALAPAEVVAATGASIRTDGPHLTLHVAPDRDDAAAGLSNSPLKTIGRAVALAAAESDRGNAVLIVVRRGVYREDVRMPIPPHRRPHSACATKA